MSAESRRLRNRLSQKAFRARQALRIKELEERLDQEPITDTSRTAQLYDINNTLRMQLLECHKKLSSLQISMRTLASSTASVLGLDASQDADDSQRLCRRCRCILDNENQQQPSPDDGYASNSSRPEVEHNQQAAPELMHEELAAPHQPDHIFAPSSSADADHVSAQMTIENDLNTASTRPAISETIEAPAPPAPVQLDFFDYLAAPERSLPAVPNEVNQMAMDHAFQLDLQIPQAPTMSLQDMMGLSTYTNLLERSGTFYPPRQRALQRTNSLFSDHISAVEYFLQRQWSTQPTFSPRDFSETIRFMISMFVSVSWQGMTAWHTYTKADVPLQDLMAWRILRTPEAYMKIAPNYRPSALQTSTVHPAIIDWIPWASLRDRLILFHSANPLLDRLICDIGNSYVAPVILSQLVADLPAIEGFISVWDLVRAIAPDAVEPIGSDRNSMMVQCLDELVDDAEIDVDDNGGPSNETPTLPAPDTQTLFSNKALAVQAFKLLGMDKGAANFYLDPAFFGRHPELYDPECNVMARGVGLRPDSHYSIPIPKELDPSVVAQYRELTKWSLGRISA